MVTALDADIGHVEAGDLVACLGEVGGHRPAHIAQPDKSDLHWATSSSNVSASAP